MRLHRTLCFLCFSNRYLCFEGLELQTESRIKWSFLFKCRIRAGISYLTPIAPRDGVPTCRALVTQIQTSLLVPQPFRKYMNVDAYECISVNYVLLLHFSIRKKFISTPSPITSVLDFLTLHMSSIVILGSIL